MKAFRTTDEVPSDFGPSAVTIGNFDGVHTGHREILRRIATIASERSFSPRSADIRSAPGPILARPAPN